ncbi:MAG TPA: divalent-cation tolerance protein CutA [Gemmatimonadales bacterium]|nr:divalent-cation tolerance protein CutA [Gemmatimonadales bacterium]
MADFVQVTTTLPDEETARRVASCAVDERLAACAQVLGPISSIYRWRGEVKQEQEWYCHLKSTGARLAALEARIRELHPYEVPEIIALPIIRGNPRYLEWIREELTADQER